VPLALLLPLVVAAPASAGHPSGWSAHNPDALVVLVLAPESAPASVPASVPASTPALLPEPVPLLPASKPPSG